MRVAVTGVTYSSVKKIIVHEYYSIIQMVLALFLGKETKKSLKIERLKKLAIDYNFDMICLMN